MPATPDVATPAATACPLCGQTNQCAMEAQRLTGVKQAPCWCTRATFTAELLARIPSSAQGVACVCAACAARISE